jgi:hypothetical protein
MAPPQTPRAEPSKKKPLTAFRLYCVPPYGVWKSPFIGSTKSTLSILGVFISICGGAFGIDAGHPIMPKVAINWAVLAAAPINSIFVWPRNIALRNRYAPPPYFNVTFSNVSPSENTPSTSTQNPCTTLPLDWTPIGGNVGTYRLGLTGGRWGVVWAKTGSPKNCRTVDVWVKRSQQASD